MKTCCVGDFKEGRSIVFEQCAKATAKATVKARIVFEGFVFSSFFSLEIGVFLGLG